MKKLCRYLLTFLLFRLSGSLFALEVSEEFHLIAPENQPLGSPIGRVYKTNPGESFYLPGIHDLAVSRRYYYFIVDDGNLWALPIEKQSQPPVQIHGQNVQSVFTHGDSVSFLTEGGTHWLFKETDLDQHLEEQGIEFLPSLSGLNNLRTICIQPHKLLLSRDHKLWGLGYNAKGQLGIPDQGPLQQPKMIVNSDVQWIAATGASTFFVRQDGSLWAIGENLNNFLGLGSVTIQRHPKKVINSHVRSVEFGIADSFYIKEDGTLWGMGNNFKNKEGNSLGVVGQRITNHVSHVAVGREGCLILKEDQSLWYLSLGEAHKSPHTTGPLATTSPDNIKTVREDGVLQISPSSLYADQALFTTTKGEIWQTNGNTTQKLISPSKITLPLDADNHLFILEGEILRNKTFLNFEKRPNYTLYFHHTDPAGYESFKKLNIQITDKNEPPNSISLKNHTIAENSPAGTIVGHLLSTDPENDDVAHFRLVDDPEGLPNNNQHFSIRRKSHQKFVLELQDSTQLNYEKQPFHDVHVEAKDVHGNTLVQLLRIHVNDVNETPADLKLSNNQVVRNTAPGTIVGRFTASDNDMGDTLSFSFAEIKNGTPADNHLFEIQQFFQNQYYLITKADFTNIGKPSLLVNIRATDSTQLSTTKAFHIYLKAPIKLEFPSPSLEETQSIGSVVGTFEHIDSALTLTLPGIHAIATSANHSMIIKGNGELWAKGDNKYSQLGINEWGGTEKKFEPEYDQKDFSLVLNEGVRSVSCGYAHTVYLTTNGSLWGMGSNHAGQLLNERNTLYTSPVRMVEKGVLDVKAGMFNTVYLTDNGTLWKIGKIGLGEFRPRKKSPILVAGPNVQDFLPYKDSIFYTLPDGSLWVYNETESPFYHKLVEEGVAKFAANEWNCYYTKKDGSTWKIPFSLLAILASGKNPYEETPTPERLTHQEVQAFALGMINGMLLMKDGDLESSFISTEIRSFPLGSYYIPDPFGGGGSFNSILSYPAPWVQREQDLQFIKIASSIESIELDDMGLHGLAVSKYGELYTIGEQLYEISESLTRSENLRPKPINSASSLLSESTDNKFFTIQDNQLILNRTLARGKASYTVRLQATTPNGLKLDRKFEIPVKSKPEAPYWIQLTKDAFPENKPVGSVVGKLLALDPDNAEDFTFRLENQAGVEDLHNDSFEIRKQPDGSSELLTRERFDYEELSSLNMSLTVEDKDGLSYSQDLKLAISDQPEPPSLTLSNQTITEDLEAGGLVGFLDIQDEDRNDVHTVTLIFGQGGNPYDNQNFAIRNRPDGQHLLILAEHPVLNHKLKPTLEVLLEVEDKDQMYSRHKFQIHVKPPLGLEFASEKIACAEEGTVLGNFRTNDQNSEYFFPGIHSISAGRDHSLYIQDNGQLWGFGKNEFGQLGIGTFDSSNTPFKILPSKISSCSAGDTHSLFIKTDGSLWGMGSNTHGQLGTGIKKDKINTPIRIVDRGVLQTIAAGGASYYLTQKGALWRLGKLEEWTSTENQIRKSGVKAFAASHWYLYYVMEDGSLWRMDFKPLLNLKPNDKERTPWCIEKSGVESVKISHDGEEALYQKVDGSIWGTRNRERSKHLLKSGAWKYFEEATPMFSEYGIPLKTLVFINKDGSTERAGVTPSQLGPTGWQAGPTKKITRINWFGNALNQMPNAHEDKVPIIDISTNNNVNFHLHNHGAVTPVGIDKFGYNGKPPKINLGIPNQNNLREYFIVEPTLYTSTYSAFPDFTSNHFFRIEGDQLILKDPGGFRSKPNHKIRVTALTPKGLHITKTFTIQVKDAEEP